MEALLYANITTLELTDDLTGSRFAFPSVTAGSHIRLKLRLSQKLEGANELAKRTVTAIKASIGNVDARPESGTYQLMVGSGPEAAGNTTGNIAFNAPSTALEEAINALVDLPAEAKPCSVSFQDGSYLIRFHDGVQRAFDCVDNALWPLSFVNVAASEFDEGFVHTLRLTQAPAASSVDLTFANAAVPKVERVQEAGEDGEVIWNEIQKLSFNPEFNLGAIQIRRGFRRTPLIGLPSSGEEFAAALASIADEGGKFIVTEQQDALLIEFGGEGMEGRSQELLEVSVFEGPEPSLQVTLNTDTAEMDVLMRRPDLAGEVKLPFEVTIYLQDEADEESVLRVPFRSEIPFLRRLNTEETNVAAEVNWNQPRARRNYAPYGPGQFLIGQRHARFVIGDGTASSFELNHDLDDTDLTVAIRENNAYGRLMRDVEFEVYMNGTNSIVVSFADPVAHHALLVLITTCSQPATFVAHTHTLDDVTGLLARLAAMDEILSHLQAIAPDGGLTVDVNAAETAVVVAEWKLPLFFDLYPTRQALASIPDSLANLASTLKADNFKDGVLLPAIHRATVYDMPSDPLSVTSEWDGNVYANSTEAPIVIPGGRGRKRDTLYPGEVAAYNGAQWYKVYKDGTSYFPAQFERSLFELSVNDRQLRYKKTFSLNFGFEVAIVTPRQVNLAEWSTAPQNTEATWSVVLEWGEFTEDLQASDEDAPESRDTATNLQGIDWHIATPILDQRIILTPTPTVHQFGCEILRNAVGDLSTNRIFYGGKEGADGPSSANFALRARLVRFDTRNDALNASGLVALVGLNRALGTTDSTTMGIAQIK